MENRLAVIMQPFRLGAAAIGWGALGIFYYSVASTKSGMALVTGTIDYFSYFTILSNIVVAMSFTLPVLNPHSRLAKLLARPDVRTGIGMYIIVTGVVYFLFLRHLAQPRFITLLANVLLHYAVPALYVLDWLAFVPKGSVRARNIPYWLLFPAVYALYTVVHGALSGFYPYPFLNVLELGYPRMLLNCIWLFAAFIVLGLCLVAVDQIIGKAQSSSSGPAAENE